MINLSAVTSPAYVLEENKLKRNLELMYHVQQETGVKIILALKGVAMFSAFPMIRRYLPGCTASSLNEALLAHHEFAGEVHAYCPVYFDNEFDRISEICKHITFNSLSQFEKFKSRCRNSSLGIRINPEYSEVKVDLYNPCIPGSRLGVRAEELPEELPPEIEGFHSHNLCECNSHALEKTLQNIQRLFGRYLPKLKWLNLGGGHLMTQKDYDVEHLISVLKTFKAAYPNLDIILEPGSAVGWETGFLVSTVQDIVERDGIKILMLDVSFACHMPDCLEMPYKPAVLGAVDAIPGKPIYRLGGCSCLAGDWIGMGDYYFENPPQIGDKIVFNDMIHYTMVKTTMFNGINLPNIGIIRENGTYQQIKTFGYEDYRNRLS